MRSRVTTYYMRRCSSFVFFKITLASDLDLVSWLSSFLQLGHNRFTNTTNFMRSHSGFGVPNIDFWTLNYGQVQRTRDSHFQRSPFEKLSEESDRIFRTAIRGPHFLWCFSVFNCQATSTGLRWILVETYAFRHFSSLKLDPHNLKVLYVKRRSGLAWRPRKPKCSDKVLKFALVRATPFWPPNRPLDQKDSSSAVLYGCARFFFSCLAFAVVWLSHPTQPLKMRIHGYFLSRICE